MKNIPTFLSALLCAGSLTVVSAQTISPYGVGFRGDGTGYYPNSKPPLEWSETKNILWKVKLPNWSYSCPVPVAGKVFMTVEPFPPHYWPRLACYDDATGKQLWIQDINPLDAFPDLTAEQRKNLTADIAWVHDGLAATYRICFPLKAKGATKADEPEMIEINKKLAEFGVAVESYTPGYGLLRKMRYLDDTKRKKVYGNLAKYGIAATTTWQNFGNARVGAAFPTPVSDGKHVYVMTVHGTVACFDLDGKRRWTKTAMYKGHHGLMSSPRLYGDLLLTAWIDTGNFDPRLMAWDKNTGEKRWEADVRQGEGVNPEAKSRGGGGLVVMTVGKTPVAVCSSGRIVRLPDGQVFGVSLPAHCGSLAVDDAGDVIFGSGSHDAGSIRWAYELRMEGEDLVLKERYACGPKSSYGVMSAVFADGRLFADYAQINPQTGAYVGEDISVSDGRKAKRTSPQTRHLLLAANGHVYGVRQEGGGKTKSPAAGLAEVYTFEGKKVAENHLPAGPWDEEARARWQQQGFGEDFSYSCSMNIGGDRLYIASQDFLYCIGNK
jgi:outer membrane protein assembly factor BamB